MRKKHIKVILSAALSLCCFFLIFTISVSAVTVSIPEPDFGLMDYDYIYNNITVSNDLYPNYSGTVGERNVDYRDRLIQGATFYETVFEYGSFLLDLDDELPSELGPTDFSATSFIDVTERFISSSSGKPVYLNYFFYLYIDATDGTQIIPYSSVFYNGIEELDVPFKKVFEFQVNQYTSVYVYQASLYISDISSWDSTADFYIRNYADAFDLSFSSDTWVFSGISSLSGLYSEIPNINWYTGEIIPGNPDSGSDYEPADPDILNSIGNNQNKLDHMEDYFNQPSPDISGALDNLDPDNLSGISGFFDSNSRFNAFLTSLMAVGVSFGLVGYVLHGKK